MTVINADLPITELLKIAADNHRKVITLPEDERLSLIALLKKRGAEELDYGEELTIESASMIRRVTGAVGIYFGT